MQIVCIKKGGDTCYSYGFSKQCKSYNLRVPLGSLPLQLYPPYHLVTPLVGPSGPQPLPQLYGTQWRNLVMPISVGMRALLLGVAQRNHWPTALVSIALNLGECLRLLKFNFIPSIPHDLDEYLNYITAYNPVQLKEGAQTGKPYNAHEGLLLVALFLLTRQKAMACTLFKLISNRKNKVQTKLNSFLRA